LSRIKNFVARKPKLSSALDPKKGRNGGVERRREGEAPRKDRGNRLPPSFVAHSRGD
jgi:hypothetical protein